MWHCELHAWQLIRPCCCTTLWKSKHRKCSLILPKKIASHRCILTSPKSEQGLSCALNLIIWGVIQHCRYETKIHDIVDLWNAWCKLGLTLTRTSQTLRFDQRRDRLRSCVRAGGGHFEHMVLNERSFIWFIRTLYETINVITGSIARSARRRYLNYSQTDFEVFRPARCTVGGEIWPNLARRAKFHPHRCNVKGVGPPKLKFLLRFD